MSDNNKVSSKSQGFIKSHGTNLILKDTSIRNSYCDKIVNYHSSNIHKVNTSDDIASIDAKVPLSFKKSQSLSNISNITPSNKDSIIFEQSDLDEKNDFSKSKGRNCNLKDTISDSNNCEIPFYNKKLKNDGDSITNVTQQIGKKENILPRSSVFYLNQDKPKSPDLISSRGISSHIQSKEIIQRHKNWCQTFAKSKNPASSQKTPTNSTINHPTAPENRFSNSRVGDTANKSDLNDYFHEETLDSKKAKSLEDFTALPSAPSFDDKPFDSFSSSYIPRYSSSDNISSLQGNANRRTTPCSKSTYSGHTARSDVSNVTSRDHSSFLKNSEVNSYTTDDQRYESNLYPTINKDEFSGYTGNEAVVERFIDNSNIIFSKIDSSLSANETCEELTNNEKLKDIYYNESISEKNEFKKDVHHQDSTLYKINAAQDLKELEKHMDDMPFRHIKDNNSSLESNETGLSDKKLGANGNSPNKFTAESLARKTVKSQQMEDLYFNGNGVSSIENDSILQEENDRVELEKKMDIKRKIDKDKNEKRIAELKKERDENQQKQLNYTHRNGDKSNSYVKSDFNHDPGSTEDVFRNINQSSNFDMPNVITEDSVYSNNTLDKNASNSNNKYSFSSLPQYSQYLDSTNSATIFKEELNSPMTKECPSKDVCSEVFYDETVKSAQHEFRDLSNTFAGYSTIISSCDSDKDYGLSSLSGDMSSSAISEANHNSSNVGTVVTDEGLHHAIHTSTFVDRYNNAGIENGADSICNEDNQNTHKSKVKGLIQEQPFVNSQIMENDLLKSSPYAHSDLYKNAQDHDNRFGYEPADKMDDMVHPSEYFNCDVSERENLEKYSKGGLSGTQPNSSNVLTDFKEEEGYVDKIKEIFVENGVHYFEDGHFWMEVPGIPEDLDDEDDLPEYLDVHLPTKIKFSKDPIQLFSTFSVTEYDRKNEEIDPVAASAEYELEKRIEKMDLFPVEIIKGENGLGLTIIGMGVGADAGVEKLGIFVKTITAGGATEKDGRIRVNDQIIEVDEYSLVGVTQLFAASVLKNTSGRVKFLIGRERDPENSEVATLIRQSLLASKEEEEELHHTNIFNNSSASPDLINAGFSDSGSTSQDIKDDLRNFTETHSVETNSILDSIGAHTNASESSSSLILEAVNHNVNSKGIMNANEMVIMSQHLQEAKHRSEMYEEEISILQMQIENLEKEIVHLRGECDSLNRMKESDSTVAEVRAENISLQEQLNMAHAQYSVLEKKYGKAKKIIKEYQNRERDFLHREEYHINQLEEKDTIYNSLMVALKDKITHLEEDLNNSQRTSGVSGVNSCKDLSGLEVSEDILAASQFSLKKPHTKPKPLEPVTDCVSDADDNAHFESDSSNIQKEALLNEELDTAVPPTELLDNSFSKAKAELATRGGLANRQLPSLKKNLSSTSCDNLSEGFSDDTKINNRSYPSSPSSLHFMSNDQDKSYLHFIDKPTPPYNPSQNPSVGANLSNPLNPRTSSCELLGVRADGPFRQNPPVAWVQPVNRADPGHASVITSPCRLMQEGASGRHVEVSINERSSTEAAYASKTNELATNSDFYSDFSSRGMQGDSSFTNKYLAEASDSASSRAWGGSVDSVEHPQQGSVKPFKDSISVFDWSKNQVAEWLVAQGLENCVSAFVAAGVTGPRLINIDTKDLKSFGLTTDDKNKIKRKIKDLRQSLEKERKQLEKENKEREKLQKKAEKLAKEAEKKKK